MFTLAAGATAVVGCFLYGTIRFIEWYNAEPVLRYSITELKAPEEKKILDNPSIKVGGNKIDTGAATLMIYRTPNHRIFNVMLQQLDNS